jgi:hypothetical protein
MSARLGMWLVSAVVVHTMSTGVAVAQTGWMQPGVRAWYLGGVDGGGVISSNATEAYLLQSVSGTTGTVVRHAALTNWTVPQPVETSAYPLLGMGPHWIHPLRLQTLAQGDYWKGQRITLVQPETHTIDTLVPQLPYPLLVLRALFDQQPQRVVYKVTYQLTLVATGNAYFDAQTGLLLYHQAMWGVTKMFFLLAEINYDFANGLAYQEDGGPHTGFRPVTSEQSQGVFTGTIFIGGGSVVLQSLVESRYGPMVQTFVQSSIVPSSWGIKTENYAFIGTGSIVRHIDWALAPSVPIEQWSPFGEHLWWWLPPLLTGAQGGAPTPGINVFDVAMAKTSDQPLTYTAAQNPSRFHFSSLTFDSHGYLTVFSARDPSTGLHVQPGDFNFQNGTTVTGLSYFQQHMALPVVGTPAISSILPAAGPTSGGTVVTIGGTNFVAGGTTVTFGGTPATNVVVQSHTSLTCTTPVGTLGARDVTVSTIGGSATAAGAFTYLQGADVTVPAIPTEPVTVSLPVPLGTVTATFHGVTSPGTLTVGAVPVPTPPVPQIAFLPSAAYFMSAPGVTFTSATVCVPYAPADASSAGIAEDSLMLWQQPPGPSSWIDGTTSHDAAGNRLCAVMTELTLAVVAGQKAAPTLPVRRYLAEGATSSFFDTTIALANPSPSLTAHTMLHFQRGDATTRVRYVAVPPLGRRTVVVEGVPEMATAEFSTVIESDQPVVADRTMLWDATGYGSHAETSIAAPSLVWYLAEGATHSGFSLFYLVQNPHPTDAAQVLVRYLLPTGAPLEKLHTVPPHSRYNIWVNIEQIPEGSGLLPLAATDVSAVLESQNGVPIIVERAMYLDRPGQFFGAGHEGAGITAPATSWFLAEGATGAYFDLFVLVANPSAVDAPITATFLLPDGTTVTRHQRSPRAAASTSG